MVRIDDKNRKEQHTAKERFGDWYQGARGDASAAMFKRDNKGLEVMLLGLQFWLVAGPLLLLLARFEAGRLNEPVTGLPRRFFEDLFGPAKEVYELHSPPLMNRTRFEQPANIMHDVMFKGDSISGGLQDVGISLWNWGAEWLWNGGIFRRCVALGAAACFWFPWMVVLAGIPQLSFMALPSVVPAFVKGPYLRRFPACLLTLDQLIIAHKQYGRQLSECYMAEVEACAGKAEGDDDWPGAGPATIEMGEAHGASRRRHAGQ